TPPRAWGRHSGLVPVPSHFRNTPTGVGKTHPGRRHGNHHQKHPHGRGEDPASVTLLQSAVETPPRAWGRRRADRYPQYRHGNTPTGVGKTQAALESWM